MTKGYRIKVGKNNYMLFKKEEDYDTLFYLERVFFYFFRHDKEDKKIRLVFRLSLIEKYIESLSEIEMRI